jgi:hypothetical protein
METDQFIYSQGYISGRIYSYLKFKKYITKIAEIVCDEMQDNQEIIDVNITPDGKTVWVTFKDSEFGFDSSLLWDKNIRNTVQNYLGYHDTDTN